MGIAAAFNASRGGLYYNSLRAETTSTNIANAATEGYSHRSIGSLSTGHGGIRATGLTRAVDASLDRMYRTEISRAATQHTVAEGLNMYSASLGDTIGENGMSARLAALQSSFDMLANAPGDTSFQRGALAAAENMAISLNSANSSLQTTIAETNRAISGEVDLLNSSLREMSRLNAMIMREPEGSSGRAAVEDQINVTLNSIAEIMAVSIQRSSLGQVQISAAGGAPLLEGSLLNEVSFDAIAGTLTSGQADITPGRAGARGANDGALAGHVRLVNEILPAFQVQLDEVARALIVGFQSAEPGLAPGVPGLFTDDGGAFSGTAKGLAGRISVNLAAKPENGGALWRMRDGMAAASEGDLSNNTQIYAFLTALDSPQAFDLTAGQGSNLTLGRFLSGITSQQQNVRISAESQRTSLMESAQAIEVARQSVVGVNVDDELQQLVDIEQSYAANSQVLRTLSEMIDSLLAAV